MSMLLSLLLIYVVSLMVVSIILIVCMIVDYCMSKIPRYKERKRQRLLKKFFRTDEEALREELMKKWKHLERNV